MRIRRRPRRAASLAPERGRLAIVGLDAFLTDAPCRRRRAEGGLRRDWLPHCRFRAVRNRIDSTPAGGGVDQPQIRGRGQRSKPGCLRQRLDPQCSRSRGLHANEIFGRHRISWTVVESRACFRFGGHEPPGRGGGRDHRRHPCRQRRLGGNRQPARIVRERVTGSGSTGFTSSCILAASKHNAEVKAAADRPRADGKPRKAVITASPASWS